MQELIKMKEELKEIRVVYIDELIRIKKNKPFFEDTFRQCFVIEKAQDNIALQNMGYTPELIIIGDTVNDKKAEDIVGSFLTATIKPEVLLLITKNTPMDEFLKLFNLGITNFIFEDFEKKDFVMSLKKIIKNLQCQRDVINVIDFEKNKPKKTLKARDLNIILLEKSVPFTNVLKNLLQKNGAESNRIYVYKTPEEMVTHMKTFPESQQPHIILFGEDESQTDIVTLTKNVVDIKKDVYMMVISNETNREYIEKVMRLGIKDVIVKPFSENNVDQKIDKALKLGESTNMGLNKFLYNIGEIVEEYKYFQFLKKLDKKESELLESYISFLQQKR
jgi:DNA-binding NarL/FixJ family response regulator